MMVVVVNYHLSIMQRSYLHCFN